jgi:hypothetical protein
MRVTGCVLQLDAKVDSFAPRYRVTALLLVAFSCLETLHAGRDSSNEHALSLEQVSDLNEQEQQKAEIQKSAVSDGEDKSSASFGDHLKGDMIEQLGREIAKNLAHELEARNENHTAVQQVAVQSVKRDAEVHEQQPPQKDRAKAVAEVKTPKEHAAVAADIMKTDGSDGLLELAEELVHKLQHHGGDTTKQDRGLQSSLATTAAGVLEHSASSPQDITKNKTSTISSDTHKQVQPVIQHKRPSIESQMKDVAADLMQLKAKVAFQKDKMGFAHALDAFQSIEVRAKPCEDFNFIDKKMHSEPIGSISRVEFLQMCQKDGVYERIDLDGSGKIDEKEYLRACKEKIIDGDSLNLDGLSTKSSSSRSANFMASLMLLLVFSAMARHL